uniref:Uncharacterized protein n=1 Tax=Parascaris equorum TaxID=6256 RepID=A0A914RS85_PAREQ
MLTALYNPYCHRSPMHRQMRRNRLSTVNRFPKALSHADLKPSQ